MVLLRYVVFLSDCWLLQSIIYYIWYCFLGYQWEMNFFVNGLMIVFFNVNVLFNQDFGIWAFVKYIYWNLSFILGIEQVIQWFILQSIFQSEGWFVMFLLSDVWVFQQNYFLDMNIWLGNVMDIWLGIWQVVYQVLDIIFLLLEF